MIRTLASIALRLAACLVVAWQFTTYKDEENVSKASPYPLGAEDRNRPPEVRWP